MTGRRARRAAGSELTAFSRRLRAAAAEAAAAEAGAADARAPEAAGEPARAADGCGSRC